MSMPCRHRWRTEQPSLVKTATAEAEQERAFSPGLRPKLRPTPDLGGERSDLDRSGDGLNIDRTRVLKDAA
jgi:hypothetical protein